VIYTFGLYYIYRLLRDGLPDEAGSTEPTRPIALAMPRAAADRE
jgi:hypothetical protein